MVKSELVLSVAKQQAHLHQRDVEVIVDGILEQIARALASGNRAELRGFGVFSVKKRGAREGRNPRTGQALSISEKRVPIFKVAKEMHRRLHRWPKSPATGDAGTVLTQFGAPRGYRFRWGAFFRLTGAALLALSDFVGRRNNHRQQSLSIIQKVVPHRSVSEDRIGVAPVLFTNCARDPL
jgi:integration host factor subunit beta